MIGSHRSTRSRHRLLWLAPLFLLVLLALNLASVAEGSRTALRSLPNTMTLLALWLLLLSSRRPFVGIAAALALTALAGYAYILLTAVDLSRIDVVMAVIGLIWTGGIVALALWTLRHRST